MPLPPTARSSIANSPAKTLHSARATHPAAPGEVGGVHFSAPFINRPVATFLLSLAIILAGAVAYKLLPVASLPQVEYPVISVSAACPAPTPRPWPPPSPRRSSASSAASPASTR